MDEHEVELLNACTDLVTLRKNDAFPRRLLQSAGFGEWVRTRDFCAQIGLVSDHLSSDLFAAWLSDPMSNDDYALIVFFDDDSKWSMTAHYNCARLGIKIQSARHSSNVVPFPQTPIASQQEASI